jgi:hypothetical protein
MIFIVIVFTIVRCLTVQYEADGEAALFYVRQIYCYNKCTPKSFLLGDVLQISLNVVDIYDLLVYKQNHFY